MADTIAIGICDDDQCLLEDIKAYLLEYGERVSEAYEIHTFQNAEELFRFFTRRHQLDLLFMDIELEDESGIKVAEKVNKVVPDCQITYLSNYLHYATEVYDTKHCYYIVKNEYQEKIPKVIERVREYQRKTFLAVKTGTASQMIAIRDIIYLEREKKTTHIHWMKGITDTRENLEELLARISAPFFVRCHNSYAVSLLHVKVYKRQEILLDEDATVPISRGYIVEVKDHFMQWAEKQLL
ncbi:MAG: LytTR family DNA-binding domain-containing protein [Lachnospiraceae bacterium]|nr:LytTR family DNA-binding domain-containing protein [Lachnospiraceae bacterium]